jgi:hypothetical protein
VASSRQNRRFMQVCASPYCNRPATFGRDGRPCIFSASFACYAALAPKLVVQMGHQNLLATNRVAVILGKLFSRSKIFEASGAAETG